MSKKSDTKSKTIEAPQNQAANFEAALNDLELLVEKLEGGELSLESSLELFEKGVNLTRQCQSALKEAEQRVQKLVQQKAAGEISAVPAEIEGE